MSTTIDTRIYSIWLDFLNDEVKPTMAGIDRFVENGLYVSVVLSDCPDTVMHIISGEDISIEFDLALRRYVEKIWGHRI